MVIERAILVLIERPTTFSYFIPAMLNLAASDLPHARDRCKIIAMVFFQSRASSSYPRGLVADAQSIVVSNDAQL